MTGGHAGGNAPTVLRTRAELLAARAAVPAGPVAVVMTMGALHDGHAALLREARAAATTVIATIFVNPLQFGAGEDLDRYPRTFEADLARCRAAGVDLVFAPDRDEVYPGGDPAVRVDPGPLGEVLEGASRPGHFAGVLTVVLKLLHLTGAGLAFFGEKDYQQLTLIRAMVRDLDLPVQIIGVPTVREADGLALSSRNHYLSTDERDAARSLSAALRAGRAAAAGGATVSQVLDAARAVLADTVKLDYLALTDQALQPYSREQGRLLIAATVGTTRLIDNTEILIETG